MVGQSAARRAAGIILEMVKVSEALYSLSLFTLYLSFLLFIRSVL